MYVNAENRIKERKLFKLVLIGIWGKVLLFEF